MKFAILIKQGPFTHQASDTAYRFTAAALAKGHEIYRVFFYNDGVYNANKLSEPQTDDRNLVNLWSELASEHDIDLVVCIAWWYVLLLHFAVASRMRSLTKNFGFRDLASL